MNAVCARTHTHTHMYLYVFLLCCRLATSKDSQSGKGSSQCPLCTFCQTSKNEQEILNLSIAHSPCKTGFLAKANAAASLFFCAQLYISLLLQITNPFKFHLMRLNYMYCKYTVLFRLRQYYGSLGTWHALSGPLKPSSASSTYSSVCSKSSSPDVGGGRQPRGCTETTVPHNSVFSVYSEQEVRTSEWVWAIDNQSAVCPCVRFTAVEPPSVFI